MSVHILYNPRSPRGAEIKSHWFDHKEWMMPENSLLQVTEDHVAANLLETFGFLREVMPKDLKAIQDQMREKPFKCDECDAQYDTQAGLKAHKLSKHGYEAGAEVLSDIPVMAPKREVVGKMTIKEAVTPEQSAGIPVSGKDSDGVEWYGEGVEKDLPSSSKTTLRDQMQQ